MVKAQMDLGKSYLDGMNGIEKNYNKAKVLFEKLANEKHMDAYYYLAKCYEHGYGVAKDEKKAIELYEIAANNGSIYAAGFLSKAYLTGIKDVIPRDKEKIIKYYNQVCNEGKKVYCNFLKNNIGETCTKINNNSLDFMGENSTIDPLCREMVRKLVLN